jgi:hypothetical protein
MFISGEEQLFVSIIIILFRYVITSTLLRKKMRIFPSHFYRKWDQLRSRPRSTRVRHVVKIDLRKLGPKVMV